MPILFTHFFNWFASSTVSGRCWPLVSGSAIAISALTIMLLPNMAAGNIMLYSSDTYTPYNDNYLGEYSFDTERLPIT